MELRSSFGLQIGTLKRRYKDLENRRHAGLGQEASSGLNKNWRYVDLNKRGDTWVSEKDEGKTSSQTRNEGTWSLKIKGF